MSSSFPEISDEIGGIETAVPEAPYRGLEPFRFIDHPIFFARAAETRKLTRFVTIYRGVLFYGDSGSGKSSLINAGLIPEILSDGFTPDRIRLQPRAGEEVIIERIATTTLGAPPYLSSNFDSRNDETASPRIIIPISNFKDEIRKISRSTYPLLIFDQFEELVTLFEEASVSLSLKDSMKRQSAILDVLVDLISDRSLPVKLLFVFREDYLAKLTKLFVRCPDLPDQYQRLTAPNIKCLYTIIRGPFEKFPGTYKREITADLTKRLAAEIEESSQSSEVNLSEAQVVCDKLWRVDSPEKLLEKRKISGLLEDYLSEALDRLAPELKSPAIALLTRMVTSSKTRNVISEDDLVYLVGKEDRVADPRIRNALQALVEHTKLVRREYRQNTIFYQLVSEFLIPWISRQKEELRNRLIRRRAYKYISFSLVIALAMGLLSWWIYTSRTEAALKDQAVQDLRSQLVVAEQEKVRLALEVETLRRILAGDSTKADIDRLYRESDEYQRQLNDTKNQLTAQKEQFKSVNEQFTTFKSDTDAARKEHEILLEAATKQTAHVMRELQDSKDKYDSLLKEKLTLEQSLAKPKTTPAVSVSSNEPTKTPEPEEWESPELKVAINGYTPNEKQARELITLVPEYSVHYVEVLQGASRIVKQVQENGYFFAEVRPTCTVTPSLPAGPNGTEETCRNLGSRNLKDHTVNITYNVDLGRRFNITGVRLQGTDKLSYDQVAKQLLTRKASLFKRGFTSLAVLEHDRKVIQKRMYELGYEASVEVQQGVALNGENLIIIFLVREGSVKRRSR